MTAMLTSPKIPPTINSSVLPERPPVGRAILAGVMLTLVGFGGLSA
jgi:hypothetical protein